MKKIIVAFLLVLLFNGCVVEKFVNRLEEPYQILWYNCEAVRIVDIDQYQYHQRIYAVPLAYARHQYRWNEYYKIYQPGDTVVLNDSLRRQIAIKNNIHPL